MIIIRFMDAVSKIRKSIYKILGQSYKLLLNFKVISDIHRSFTQNKTKFTKYCLTQWISKLSMSFEIHHSAE